MTDHNAPQLPTRPVPLNIDLADLRALLAVVDLGAFNAAAEQLNLSQPALSRRIQKIERALGVRLLERTTRRVELTDIGREFVQRARQSLEDLDAAFVSTRDNAESPLSQVNVACVPTAAHYFLPEVIAAFNREFPITRVWIMDGSAQAGVERVRSGLADFGINFLGGQEAEIDFEPLVQDAFVMACRHDHPLAKRKTVGWRDLEPYRFITAGRGTGNRLVLDHGLAKVPSRPKWFYETGHFSTLLGLVEAGLGVAALPRIALPPGSHPILVSRPLRNPVITRTIAILTRRGRALSPAAEAFLRAVRGAVGAFGGAGRRPGRGHRRLE